jgi:hypothetical protein
MHRLQAAGVRCGSIDLTAIGTQQVTPEQWYASVVGYLVNSFQLKFNLRAWWRGNDSVLRAELSPISRLSEFLEQVLLVEIQQNIVIFMDEIDSVLGLEFPIEDFFGLIRVCYNRRAENPAYKRLTFAMFGVAMPMALMTDTNRTPFNIGRAIQLVGFAPHEVTSLVSGLAGIVQHPDTVLQQILYWTGGQPFLTQKLCHLVRMASHKQGEKKHNSASSLTSSSLPLCASSSPSDESCWVDQLVHTCIIENWEAQDEPEHLKTIRDRLCRSPSRNRLGKNEQRVGHILGIYQQILQNQNVLSDDSPEQVELLLSGLLVKCDGTLKVHNPIYQAVFSLEWVNRQLEKLPSYTPMFSPWLSSVPLFGV